MAHRIEKMSVGTAVAMFLIFSAIFGFTLSIYLFLYDLTAVILCFLLTGAYFGGLAAFGFLTKKDLSGIRPVLVSGLIFLIAFGILSLFIPGLQMLDRVVCLIGIRLLYTSTGLSGSRARRRRPPRI